VNVHRSGRDAASEPNEAAALDAYSQVVADVAARLLPCVAALTVTRRVRGGAWPSSGGSAVAFTSDGLLLTSAHVVAGADGGRLSFGEDLDDRFEVVATDRLSDLAVIRGTARDLAVAELGDADGLRIGQLVVAVGNPLGFAGSVSAGVVSGMGRTLPTRDGAVVRLVEDVIQTDAALHPGNSGGALADTRGRVVGIATALVGPTVGQGLGLAVPINARTQRLVAEMIRDGGVRRAFLGIDGGRRPLPPRAVGPGRTHGIEVLSVVSGSPADVASIRPEDIIVAVDGTPVDRVGRLQDLLTTQRIGRAVELEVVRGGELRSVQVTPTELR
jgi:S1-C subfamily serine protease